ncbi:glycosyl hydrolase family 28-related protein [Clostridium manihotivorum]|nr:hypothetical protein [Clostridium manihotivorum]
MIFDIRDFGAKCDGVTDDTIAIQNTINYVESIGGGFIKFPYGKTIKVSMAGSRAIQTWHSGPYNRRYSILVGSNIEIDFNYCIISCQLDMSTGYAIPVNIIGNKLASNTDIGNKNIILRNGVFDQNVTYLNFDPSHVGNYDVIAMEFNNTENLVLDNITVQNVFGYGVYICNSRNFKLNGKTKINNVIGNSLRIGWGDNTRYGYVEDVEIHNNSNIYQSYVPGNTIYVIAENIRFHRIYQTLDPKYIPSNFDINSINNYNIGSVTLANGCNNITIDECYSYYLAFKIQDYSGTAKGSPDNINIGKMYFSHTFFYQQAKKCYINQLILDNGSYADSNNGECCYINQLIINKSGNYYIKGNYSKELYINEIISNDSPSVLSTAPNVNIYIQMLYTTRNDSSLIANTVNNYLIDLGSGYKARIERVVYFIGSNDSIRKNYIKLPVGGSIGSVTGIMVSSDGATTSKVVDNFSITLTAGVQSIINLSNNSLGNNDSSVYKNGNNMHRVFDLVPMNSLARSVTISKVTEVQYGEKIMISHSAASGGEVFFIKVLSYEQLPSVGW